MPALTTTWAIPYPLGSDTFCDGYLYTQQMAERVDAILDAFDVDLARVEVVPLVRVSSFADHDEDGFSDRIRWQGVDFDTRGDLANLSLDNEYINTLEGYGVVGGFAYFKYGVGSVGASYTIDQQPIALNNSGPTEQRDNADIARLVNMQFDRLTQDDQTSLMASHFGTTPAGTPTLRIFGAYFWYMWVGDL